MDRHKNDYTQMCIDKANRHTMLTFASSSRYWSPFCTNVTKAPGGTKLPSMLLLLIPASYPSANAECVKPEIIMKNHNYNHKWIVTAMIVHTTIMQKEGIYRQKCEILRSCCASLTNRNTKIIRLSGYNNILLFLFPVLWKPVFLFKIQPKLNQAHNTSVY